MSIKLMKAGFEYDPAGKRQLLSLRKARLPSNRQNRNNQRQNDDRILRKGLMI